jgi:hypothetical protein
VSIGLYPVASTWTLQKYLQIKAEVQLAMTAIEKEEPSSDPVTEQVAESPSNDVANEAPELELVKGWRLYMLTLGYVFLLAKLLLARSNSSSRIWIALFLSTLETTIVSTCLVAISDSLNGFERRNWIVTSYFLTYTGECQNDRFTRDSNAYSLGFLIIYAKMSSIFGKKTLFLVALVIFTAFSIACGAVNSMISLYISLHSHSPHARI